MHRHFNLEKNNLNTLLEASGISTGTLVKTVGAIEVYLSDVLDYPAEALQRAQVKLLDDPAFDHPAYWSPFLLLNNWL